MLLFKTKFASSDLKKNNPNIYSTSKFNVELDNVVSTLKIGCSTSPPNINVNTTLNQRRVYSAQKYDNEKNGCCYDLCRTQ